MLAETRWPTFTIWHSLSNAFYWMYMWISIKISLKFVPKGPVNNIPALLQTMPRHRPGDKPVSEAIMVRLLTHICVTRPEINWRIYTSLDFNKLTDLSHLLDFAVQVCNMILNCPSIFSIYLCYTPFNTVWKYLYKKTTCIWTFFINSFCTT